MHLFIVYYIFKFIEGFSIPEAAWHFFFLQEAPVRKTRQITQQTLHFDGGCHGWLTASCRGD